MLIDINSSTEKVITKIPHRTSFEAWKKQISKEEYQAIIDELNRRIDLLFFVRLNSRYRLLSRFLISILSKDDKARRISIRFKI